MGIIFNDTNHLAQKLQKLSHLNFEAVILKNMTQIYERGQRGGTPISTEATRPGGPHGELRGSLGQSKDTVGYTKEYAPHVEYGHRTVNGGYVPGQRFLKKNVDKQRSIFERDLRNELRKS